MPIPIAVTAAVAVIQKVVEMVKEASQASSNDIVDRIDGVLTELYRLEDMVARVGRELYAELQKVIRQLDDNVIKDRLTQSRTAVLTDLRVYQRTGAESAKIAALDNSFAAADRIAQEDERYFLGALVLVVSNRLTVLKALDPGFRADPDTQAEVLQYVHRLEVIVNDLKHSIDQMHTVRSTSRVVTNPATHKPASIVWSVQHLRAGQAQSSYVVGRSTNDTPRALRVWRNTPPLTTGRGRLTRFPACPAAPPACPGAPSCRSSPTPPGLPGRGRC